MATTFYSYYTPFFFPSPYPFSFASCVVPFSQVLFPLSYLPSCLLYSLLMLSLIPLFPSPSPFSLCSSQPSSLPYSLWFLYFFLISCNPSFIFPLSGFLSFPSLLLSFLQSALVQGNNANEGRGSDRRGTWRENGTQELCHCRFLFFRIKLMQ